MILLLIAFSFTCCYGALGQQCAPNFPDLSNNFLTSDFVHRQLIIPQYTFSCPAVITGWEVYIKGPLARISRLIFQVWRLNVVQNKYFVVKSSTYRLGDTSQQIRLQNGKIVMPLESNKSRISVKSGDIVGVFIRGSGVRIKYLTSRSIHTYAVIGTTDPLQTLSADSLSSIELRQVAPLIRVLVDVNGATGGTTGNVTGFVPGLATTLPTLTPVTDAVYTPTETSQLPETFTTPIGSVSREDPKYKYRDYLRHRLYLIVGVATAGVIIVLMCICMAIVITLLVICVKKKKGDGGTTDIQPHQNIPQNTISSGYSSGNYSSGNCSLSFLPMDTTSRVNLLAFRKQEAARNIGSIPNLVTRGGESRDLYYDNNQNQIEDLPDHDTYVEIPPRIYKVRSTVSLGGTSGSIPPSLSLFGQSRITLKENPSYLVLHSAKPAEVHEYDEVPFVLNSAGLPYEYEVPTTTASTSSSARPTPTPYADDVFVDDKVIYEEI